MNESKSPARIAPKRRPGGGRKPLPTPRDKNLPRITTAAHAKLVALAANSGLTVASMIEQLIYCDRPATRRALESIRDTAIAMKDAYKINPRSVLFAEAPERIRDRACDALAGHLEYLITNERQP